ncbi:MAG: 2Fe-2S iron-sulfur cluster binding domain-containing protein [Myxococcales bacterium]|nr:2Fe-2S iron-sulfur cluster binding domain-containing protein [Myxococcales bacterium]
MSVVRYRGRELEVAAGETVLEALEAAGEAVPSSCRAGTCQTCTLRCLEGELPEAAQVGLSPAKRRLGYFLACVCRPGGDLEVAPLDDADAVPATITGVERAGGDVLLVRLRPARPLAHEAGQFVSLIRDDGLARPYSLASLPGDEELVLHVRHYPDGQMSGWLAGAPIGASLTLRGPSGECFYIADDPARPLLLVGTGTGLAPLEGILRAALHQGHKGPITLIHGARTAEGLYRREALEALAAAHPNVEVIFSALAGDPEPGVVDTPVDRLALARAKAADRSTLRVYLCGDPGQVSALRRRLFIDGLALRSILADAFLPAAPRPAV